MTLLILGRDRLKDATRGYATTFLRQLEEGSASRASAACGSSPTRAGSTRPRSPTPYGSWPTGSGADARRARRGRRPHRARRVGEEC
ncbi:hypothetical protein NKH77_23625 [Streptomyces sp. M19]